MGNVGLSFATQDRGTTLQNEKYGQYVLSHSSMKTCLGSMKELFCPNPSNSPPWASGLPADASKPSLNMDPG